MSNVYDTLSVIDVSPYTEEKNGLTYLKWSWAWGKMKELYPSISSKIYENDMGLPYFTDGKTCFVKVGVTVENREHIEWYPVTDYKNQSISVDKVTSFDINSAIQRGITKAIARHGLGLYLYTGSAAPEKKRSGSQIIGSIVVKANTRLDELKGFIDNAKEDDDIDDFYNEAIQIYQDAKRQNLPTIINHADGLFPTLDVDSGFGEEDRDRNLVNDVVPT